MYILYIDNEYTAVLGLCARRGAYVCCPRASTFNNYLSGY